MNTYLYSAVKHRCLDLIRKKALKEKYVSEEMANQQANPGHHDFPVDLDGEKFEHIVRNAIEMLPERARIIYKMRDRKSTRLNSSHVAISYAVFCLKKKKKIKL